MTKIDLPYLRDLLEKARTPDVTKPFFVEDLDRVIAARDSLFLLTPELLDEFEKNEGDALLWREHLREEAQDEIDFEKYQAEQARINALPAEEKAAALQSEGFSPEETAAMGQSIQRFAAVCIKLRDIQIALDKLQAKYELLRDAADKYPWRGGPAYLTALLKKLAEDDTKGVT